MPTPASSLYAWGSMIKFSHTVFALPFAVLATFLAARPAYPSATQFVLIVICMVAARSAAMTFNRLLDQRIDAQNPRTSNRPLVTGRITRRAAWAFFLGACGLFALACAGFQVLADNPWPLLLCAPVLALLCFYSYTKYFTRWSHLVLGASIALSPVAAWIAINPATLGWHSWLIMLAVMFWIAGFDLIYACQDADFDRGAGLNSVPAGFGVATSLWLARGAHLVAVVLLIAVGRTNGLGLLYYIGVGCVAVLLTIENAIVSPDDLSRVNVAFFTVNGVVGLLLGTLGVLDIVLR